MLYHGFQEGVGGEKIKNIEKIEKSKNPDFGAYQILYTCRSPKIRSVAPKL